jgi:hypothetical protein
MRIRSERAEVALGAGFVRDGSRAHVAFTCDLALHDHDPVLFDNNIFDVSQRVRAPAQDEGHRHDYAFHESVVCTKRSMVWRSWMRRSSVVERKPCAYGLSVSFRAGTDSR